MSGMKEIVPGVWHWAAPHPRIKIRVHSYHLSAERTLIDPIAPTEGLDWFAEHGPPHQILLTNRHHYRSSGDFVERFDVSVRCVREGLHAFEQGEPVQPFDFGDELPGGIVAHEVDAICPDETALYLRAHRRRVPRDRAGTFEPPVDGVVPVVGVEPVGAAKFTAALRAGHPVALESTESLADGLKPKKRAAMTDPSESCEVGMV